MFRVSIEEKRRIAKMLSHPNRPLQRIQDMQFLGLFAQRRQRELSLASTTAMERVLTFLAGFGQAVSLH